MDTLNGRRVKYYLLTTKGIEWYYIAKEIEAHIFQIEYNKT